MNDSFEITCTPIVKVIRVYPSVNILKRMFKVVYRLTDFKENINEVFTTDEKVEKFLITILERGHTSVLEFINVLWYTECSRVASHQIVRHRIASFWQESQRYRKPCKAIVPRTVLNNIELRGFIEESFRIYNKYVENCKDFGEDVKELYRYVLTNAIATRLFVQMNLRELIESFLGLRMCRRAQPETRYIAYKLCYKLFIKDEENRNKPHFEHFGRILINYVPRCRRFRRCLEYGFSDPEKIRKCISAGIVEAIKEHGTERELEDIDNIIRNILQEQN